MWHGPTDDRDVLYRFIAESENEEDRGNFY